MWLQNKMARGVTEMWECVRKKWLENKMAQDVTEPAEGLSKTWF